MAKTSYGVGDALAVKHWSRILWQEALKETYFNRFIAKDHKGRNQYNDTSGLITLKKETAREKGDKVTWGLRMLLTGDGVSGDGALEGNEEALTTYSDAIFIDQLRHAVRSAGKMSEQRVPFSVREEAKNGLKDWWADRIDTAMFNQLCGYTAETDVRYTGMQSASAPTAGRHQWAGVASADEGLISSEVFDLQLIDAAVETAKTASPLIRPIKYMGENYYVMFLHPYQVTALRTTTSTGQWLDIQKAAMQGGDVTDNPIFTGALGVYNGVILHESTRVTQGVNSSTGVAVATARRAVLCGAQSGCIAFGTGKDNPNDMTWVEELFDYGNQLGVSAGCTFGLKKAVFNSLDFGTIVVSTYAAAS